MSNGSANSSPAPAERKVVGSDEPHQSVGDPKRGQLISDVMPERVVDRLEAFNVDEQNPELVAPATLAFAWTATTANRRRLRVLSAHSGRPHVGLRARLGDQRRPRGT